ncbi:pentatricopeptide repeat-containing protein At1g74600, chloroplastic-like [Dendrobium catenatum]|uniref:Pentatricopeptide repeat-containing protein n=1 Tax=Dendrobium catenatum TaxID=906689 RepID=A0A2I0X4W3_9ASPA|nr:pentatricopeptide repeat-containing protein At1g74600, chloroplastic-like [Dendrobium catenatum]PKU82964.1 Pentatricopeptide repeat-containing protein [Dendrobium catenatum]
MHEALRNDSFSDQMRYWNSSFGSLDLTSVLRVLPFSLTLKKSPPSSNIRFHTSLASSHTLRELQTPENHSNCFRVQSEFLASIQRSGSRSKSGLLQDALLVLDEIHHKDPILWNVSKLSSALRTFNQSSQFDSTVRIFKIMRSAGLQPDQFAYANVILACTAMQKFNLGNLFLSLVMKVGFLTSGYVLSGLIDLFAKGGCFVKALDIFLYGYSDNLVCWNAVIAGAVRNGESWIALKLFHQMVESLCMPNGFTFSSLLGACAAVGELDVGRTIHAWIVKFNQQDDIFVGTAAIDLYAKCGDMDAAVKMFLSMPARNVVSWTALISGFVLEEDGESTLKYFIEMLRNNIYINAYTITSVLFACAKCCMANISYQIHGLIFKSALYTDPAVNAALINLYGRIGNVQMSEKVFKEGGMEVHLINWSAMISSLVQNQYFSRALELFLQMLCEDLKPDKSCISCILSIVDCIIFGEQLHSYIVKVGLVDDLLVCSSIFTMYSKCGSIGDSYELFGQMPDKDRVAWTSMISGFARHGNAKEAFQLFREMILEGIKPDDMALSAAFTACNSQIFLDKGKEIHGFSFRHGLSIATVIGSSTISMYSKCKDIESARRVFAYIQCKDQILWSSLISAYSTNNKSEEAILDFHRMTTTGLEIDHITCSSVLVACAQLFRPILGTQIHGQAIKAGLILHNSVASSLLTLYAKCGIISECRKLFDGIQNPDLTTWTTMIEGYARHGRAKEALETFDLMKNNGMKPDSVTFVSILSACSHNGLVNEGFFYFESMSSDYGIEPETRHYSCMVDLLGRAGRLKEAVDLIDRMPTEPGLLVWSTLLGACRVYGDEEIGGLAKKKVLDFESPDSGAHIAASNMSADIGDWEQVVRIRSSMKGFGMKKEPGWSAL